MRLFLCILMAMYFQQNLTIFEFNDNCNLQLWGVVDDNVMGGISNGQLLLNDHGVGVFKGHVSIENNGGFSSIQCRTKPVEINNLNTIVLVIKGDGSLFQFRVKNKLNDRHSYTYNFKTSGKWETIHIPLSDLEASFRGFKLNLPNFNKNIIEQIGFLKSAKSEVDFKLELKSIGLTRQ